MISKLLVVCFFAYYVVPLTIPLGGYEVEHSFASPPKLPYWTMLGDCYATEEAIRIVPDRQGKRGALWNSKPNARLNNWEATYEFRVHGVSSVGADGLAFWYTQQMGSLGATFGNTEYFAGLGVIVDTYDNNAKGDHPYLSILLNNGQKKFDNAAHSHGNQHQDDIEIGGCSLSHTDLSKTSLTTMKISYKNGVLGVEYDNSGTGKFTSCFEKQLHTPLPPNGYFGFSAATGDLADNHDVHAFYVKNLEGNAPVMNEQGMLHFVTGALSKLQAEIRLTSGSSPEIADIKKGVESIMGVVAGGNLPSGDNGNQLISEFQNLKADFTRVCGNRDNIPNTNFGVASNSSSGGSWFPWILNLIFLLIIVGLGLKVHNADQERKKKFFS